MKNFLLLLFILILNQCAFASSRTWTGTVSTNWSTAANWSPSSPSWADTIYIHSSSNKPVLSGNTYCYTIILTSGAELDLGGYLLTINGRFAMNEASIKHGDLQITGPLTYQSIQLTNSQLDVTILALIGTSTISNCVFKKASSIAVSSSSPSYCGGNTFEKSLKISNEGAADLYFGYDAPDTFQDSLQIISYDGVYLNPGVFHFAHNSVNTQINGFCRIDMKSNSSIYFCDGADSASVDFYAPVLIGNNGANALEFTRNAHFHSGAPISLSETGWFVGELRFRGVTLDDSLSIQMDDNQKGNSLYIDQGSIFNSKVNCSAQSIYIGNSTFNDSTSFVKIGPESNQPRFGPIITNAPFSLTNSGTGSFLTALDDSCSFRSDLSLINTDEGSIDIASNGFLSIGGDLKISSSAGRIALGEYSTDTNIVQGNINLNCTGGLVVLGMIKQGSSGTIYTTSFANSELDLLGFRSTNTDSITFTGTDNSRLVLSQCQIQGPLNVELPSIVTNGGFYHGNTLLHKTGSGYDQGGGSMVFYGKAHFKTSSDGYFLLNYDASNNQFWDDLIIECTGDGKVMTASDGSSDIYKNLEFRGSTSPDLNQGSAMRFVGEDDQHIESTGTFNDFSMATLNVEKPNGQLIIDVPLHILSALNLSKGIVQISDTNSLFLEYFAIASQGSDSSYVEGAISKMGITEFTFPTGGGGQYAPISIDSVSSNTTFKASYFGTDPNSNYSRSSKDSTLGFVNRCGYWKLDRTAGTGTTNAKLGWSNNPCYSSNPVDAKITIWDGSQWKDKGNGTYSGNSTIGNVQAVTSINSFPTILNLVGKCFLTPSYVTGVDTFLQKAQVVRFSPNQKSYQFSLNNQLLYVGKDSILILNNAVLGDTINAVITENTGCESKISLPTQSTESNTVVCNYMATDRLACGGCSQYINDPSYVFPENSERYYKFKFYQPSDNSSTFIPIKRIGINVIVVQNSAPNLPGNFEDIPSHINAIRQVFETNQAWSIKSLFTGNGNPSDPIILPINELNSARIDFYIERILFMPVTNTQFNADYSSSNLRLNLYQQAIAEFGCEIEDDFNYFLVNNVGGAYGNATPPSCNQNDPMYAFSRKAFESYQLNGLEGFVWAFTRHVAHEIAHMLDLVHLYQNGIYCTIEDQDSDFDGLLDLFGVIDGNDLNCPHGQIVHPSGCPPGALVVDPYINDPNDPCYTRTTNNVMGGNYQSYLYYSPNQVGKIHKAASITNLKRFIDDCPYSSTPIGINMNETWELDIRVYNDIIVYPGRTLTITCKVEFPDDAMILIQPGGKLILDGGTLTSSCTMWRGIRLMGIASQPQGTLANTVQGVVEMKNHAVIENAEEGIFMSDAGDNMYGGVTGGIVVASNSTFRNNWRSVSFHPYTFPSISKFTNCLFICDDHLKNPDYFDSQTNYWLASQMFVSAWEIKGVIFRDNIFLNDGDFSIKESCTTTEYPFLSHDRTQGIALYDAQVRVLSTNPNNDDQSDLNADNALRNRFIGLTRGIITRVTNTSIGYNVYSSGSLFDNCRMGIYSENARGDNYINNDFNIPDSDGNTSVIPDPYGIYFYDYRTANKVQLNNFIGSGSAEPYNWGLITRGLQPQSSGINMLIQRNDFTNLQRGFQSEYNNPYLFLKCNDFTNNNYDWHINPLSMSGVFNNQGIGCGPAQYRPGNIFNDQGVGVKHIWAPNNQTPDWYYYARPINVETPVFSSISESGSTTICGSGLSNPCPSGTGALNIISLNAERRQFKFMSDSMELQKQTILENLDGMQTDSLLGILSDTTQSSADLSIVLTLYSPLSDSVLVTALRLENLFSNNELINFMLLNLPATQKVLNELRVLLADTNYYQATRDSLLGLQKENAYVQTHETYKRAAHHFRGEWLTTISKIESSLLERDEWYELAALYKDSLGTGFERSLFSTYLGSDSLDQAEAVLDSITLSTLDDSLFVDYHKMYLNLLRDSLTWLTIDTTILEDIRNMASIPSSVQQYALAVLQLRGDTTIEHYPENAFPPSARLANEAKYNRKSKNILTRVYPNPNDGKFTLQVNDYEGNLIISLVDLSGRLIRQINQLTERNQLIELTCNDLSNGIYLLNILDKDGRVLGHHKISLIH